MFSAPQYTTSERQQYNYFVMQEPVFEEKIEEPVFMCVYEENGVLYCASSTSKEGYYYTYVLNNPLKYIDPTGYITESETDLEHVISNLLGRPGSSWSPDGGYRYVQDDIGDGTSGWFNSNMGGAGGFMQPIYGGGGFSGSLFGKFTRVYKPNKGRYGFIYQHDGFQITLPSIIGYEWVPDSPGTESSIFTPLEPTPWLSESIENIYPRYSIRTQGLSRSTSALRTVETSYKAVNWGVTGAAFAMKYSRINTNIHYKVGSLTSFWKYYAPLKNTSAAMNASFVPYAFATWHLYDDIMSYQSGDIDEAELGFNTLTNYYGAYLSVSSGAAGLAWGAVYGVWIWGNREIYKNYLKPTFEGIYWHMYNLTHPY